MGSIGIRDVTATRESEKALLCEFERPRHHQYWVPKSQIRANSEVRKFGDCGTLVISDWWFEKYQERRQQDEIYQEYEAPPPQQYEMVNAKRIFRQLAIEYHPDRGGDAKTMQALNRLWEAVKQDLRGGNR
jgi:hypothetical protein